MGSLIKHPKDFYAGLMYAAIGLGAIFIARDYNLGSSVRMGPGYFPTVLGGLLALVGFVSIARSFLRVGEAIEPFFWKGIILVLGSAVLFGLLARLLLPLALMISMYFLMRGHNAPGGGFVGGLVFATAIILQYIVSGVYWIELRLRILPLS